MAKYDLDIEIRPPRCPSCRNDITYRLGSGFFHGLINLVTGFKRYRCRYCEKKFWTTRPLAVLTRSLGALLIAFVVLGYLTDAGLLRLKPVPSVTKALPVKAPVQETAPDQTPAPSQATAAPQPLVVEEQPSGQGGGEAAQAESTVAQPEAAEALKAGGKSTLKQAAPPPPLKPEAIVFFKVRSFKPGPEHRPILQKLVAQAEATPELTISLVGFADASPLSAATRKKYGDNKGISKARAQAVADALAEMGLDRARLEVIGGGVDPQAADADAARRVEVWLGRVKAARGKVTALGG